MLREAGLLHLVSYSEAAWVSALQAWSSHLGLLRAWVGRESGGGLHLSCERKSPFQVETELKTKSPIAQKT